MKKDDYKTRVIFLLEKDPAGILAVFPDKLEGVVKRECYSHIGQHGSASDEYWMELKPASKEQYRDLKEELESIGYDLELIETVVMGGYAGSDTKGEMNWVDPITGNERTAWGEFERDHNGRYIHDVEYYIVRA
jgi:hypothetical protein